MQMLIQIKIGFCDEVNYFLYCTKQIHYNLKHSDLEFKIVFR